MPKLPPTLLSDPAASTSYDVAALAGVSQSAVSRAFREGTSVAPKTRAKIMRAAKQLGYQPNAFARGLITRRTALIAVVISNLTNLNYPEVLAELTQRLSARGQRVLLFTLPAESAVDDTLDQIWPYRVDGAIVAARLSDAQIGQFHERGVPLVLYNRTSAGAPVASVGCDSAAGVAALVDGLAAAGHRNFGIIAGPADNFVGQERLSGALAALTRLADIPPPLVHRGGFDYGSGAAGLAILWDAAAAAGRRLDALICTNDAMAIGAVDHARTRLGLAVPGDLSVVGFDGVGPAGWAAYQLTTVRQPVRRMTEAAVEMLMDRIARPGDAARAGEARLFGGELIAGQSARLALPAGGSTA